MDIQGIAPHWCLVSSGGDKTGCVLSVCVVFVLQASLSSVWIYYSWLHEKCHW